MIKLVVIGIFAFSIINICNLIPLFKDSSYERTIQAKRKLNITLVGLCALDLIGICLFVINKMNN